MRQIEEKVIEKVKQGEGDVENYMKKEIIGKD